MNDYFDIYVAACTVAAFFGLIFLANRLIDGPKAKKRARERSLKKRLYDIDREADALIAKARRQVEARELAKKNGSTASSR